ncbi:hypothetical protein [Bacillus sp. AFS017336]|uniref:hypothetical protein n=1 Tax=Bacillus sp. AFS017336 TaxID=2033489 RepID=UPI00115536CB|nr:hypothetical protein [Bacillus sp. AFS017336]
MPSIIRSLNFNTQKYPEVVYAQKAALNERIPTIYARNSPLYEQIPMIYAQKPPFYEPTSQKVRAINNSLAIFQRTAATQKFYQQKSALYQQKSVVYQ